MPSPSLQLLVEEFARESLPADAVAWCNRYVAHEKIVHDALWGTLELQAHEVALIDTPLLQRLRYIRQTGAVYLTYPSAVHTRFEHTIGVLAQATRMCAVFRRRKDERRIDDITETNIRLAAIMHDTGHGPFSHTSEQFFSVMAPIAEIKASDEYYRETGAGEILSSLLVRSKAFRRFVQAVNDVFKLALDADAISAIITGNMPNERMYESEILHGPFDADKLDYMHRDGMFTGLRMHVDLDRLFASMRIQSATLGGRTQTRLVGSLAGTSPLTQIMFNKMLLFTGIYHHHKVRAVDCMLWAMFELAATRGTQLGGVSISTPVDFLRTTDDRVLIEELTNDPDIATIIRSIRSRTLWRRALVISRRTVPSTMHEEAGEVAAGLFEDFALLAGNDREKIRRRRAIAADIWKRAGKPCAQHEVWLDVPRLPPMDEAEMMWIQAPGQANPETLGQFIPITKWVELYGTHKWQSHVFCRPDVTDAISTAAEKVLHDWYGLEFSVLARQYAHVGT